MIEAKVILKSRNVKTGDEVVTFEIYTPKFLLAQINKHRLLSICSESSRAKPVKKTIEQILKQPFKPNVWLQNGKGMVSSVPISKPKAFLLDCLYSLEVYTNVFFSYLKSKLGLHKQYANRNLEAYMMVRSTITATEWTNFFNLRLGYDAQPEFQELAQKMKHALDSAPTQNLEPGEWHLPYTEGEDKRFDLQRIATSCAVSGRCGRYAEVTKYDIIKYISQDRDRLHIPISEELVKELKGLGIDKLDDYYNMIKDIRTQKDLALFDFFRDSKPAHLTPLEHACMAINTSNDPACANLRGFISYRKFLPNESVGCVDS